MTRTSTRRLVTALVLALIVLLGAAAWLTTWLARTEPEFNQYLKMVPLLKPFRYYPPDPPAWVPPLMPENLTLICPQSLYQSIRESRLSHTTGRIPRGIPS